METVRHTVRQDCYYQIEVRRDTQTIVERILGIHHYHRHIVQPGDDVSNEHISVQRAAQKYHTPEVTKAWKQTLSRRKSC